MKTEDLITLIVQDTRKSVNLTVVLSGAVVAGALVSGLAFFLILGVRHDIGQAIETVRFGFKFVVTLSLFAAALSLAGPAIRPGGDIRRRRWLLLIVPILLLGASALELLLTPSDVWLDELVGHNALHCLTMIPVLSAFPGVFLFFAMGQGAPENPAFAGAVAGLISAGIAATLYATNCFDDSPLFVATWYPLATLIVVTIGYFAGKRFLRW